MINEAVLHKLAEAVERAKLPGMAAAVVNRQDVLFAGGWGIRRMGDPAAVDADTLFAIASNTKAFTASAIGLLVDEGKLAWDAPVLDYLPDFQLYDPQVTRKITLRDLLCHRSGLATWGGDLTWYGSTYSMEEVIRRVRYQPPAYDFRTGYGYCNLMFMTAGLILEKVTGQKFGEFLRQRIFAPLGMARTCTSILELSGMDNIASPHTPVQGVLSPISYRSTDNNSPAGCILSSVNELSRWLRLQLNEGIWNGKRVLSEAVINETRTPHTLIVRPAESRKLNPCIHLSAYGLGWQLADYRGHLLVLHGGALDGMFSMSAFLPDAGVGTVVLTNSDTNMLYMGAVYTLLDAALGVEEDMDWTGRCQTFYDEGEARKTAELQAADQARARDSQPSHPLADYAGEYTNAIYGDLRVELTNGTLVLLPQAHPDVSGPLTHWQYDSFTAVWSEPVWGKSLVLFSLDAKGAVHSLSFRVSPDYLDPLEYVFTRKQA